ncbi:hypothetical protein Lste_3192 [Legionella steelei]|uniref:Transmembrane protein n=2 Tax=Legionella steelei TaxID=947033 RepID=A0A0W0ZDJ8_9GAMM|nr:hypothetical protein Lste_3192 [Legionella steelei]
MHRCIGIICFSQRSYLQGRVNINACCYYSLFRLTLVFNPPGSYFAPIKRLRAIKALFSAVGSNFLNCSSLNCIRRIFQIIYASNTLPMDGIMADMIILAMSNFTLTCFILGLLCALLEWLVRSRPMEKAMVIELIFSWYLLFNIGLAYLFNFIMHVFFGDFTAQFIGWPQSPFQMEVGFASLGIALNGIISFKGQIAFRAATIIVPALFLWGAAGGHLYQMIVAHNFEPGNAGSIFWTDIFMPIIAFLLLWLQYRNPENRVS